MAFLMSAFRKGEFCSKEKKTEVALKSSSMKTSVFRRIVGRKMEGGKK